MEILLTPLTLRHTSNPSEGIQFCIAAPTESLRDIIQRPSCKDDVAFLNHQFWYCYLDYSTSISNQCIFNSETPTMQIDAQFVFVEKELKRGRLYLRNRIF